MIPRQAGAMRIRGHPSWRLAIDEPGGLHLVLSVRDCYRLPVAARSWRAIRGTASPIGSRTTSAASGS